MTDSRMSPPALVPTAFTCRYPAGRSLTLTSEVEISPAFIPPANLPGLKYRALYDTGATQSSISPKVVNDLGLASIGATIMGVAGGTLPTTCHLVNIGLPNRVVFAMIRVAKADLHHGIDVLVGMDILTQGDFAVSNHNGKTTFSFCCPSQQEIDFVADVEDRKKVAAMIRDKIGLNSLCPCGSGKKYKKCCRKKRA